jgi:hypothetical protein
VVEIYVFYEMADAGASKESTSKIQILDFEGTPPYQAAELVHEWSGAGTQRFDVRACRCASTSDEERMLAVMESTGAGLSAFNTWMHNLLLDKPDSSTHGHTMAANAVVQIGITHGEDGAVARDSQRLSSRTVPL